MSEPDTKTATQDASPTEQTTPADAPVPWEMIEPGRYQPKRTRGSCVGRELG
jgi:hypothetical protein